MCFNTHQDQTECANCEWRLPSLWAENREEWDLWNTVKTQWRTGMVGVQGFITPCPIGLDYPAVYAVAKTLNIDIAPATLFKLQALEFYEKNRKQGEGGNGSE